MAIELKCIEFGGRGLRLAGVERNMVFSVFSARTALKFLPYGSMDANLYLARMKTLLLKIASHLKYWRQG